MAAIAAPVILISPLIAVGIITVIGLIVLASVAPGAAIGVWLVALSFIPAWTQITALGVTLEPAYLNIPIAIGLTVHAVTKHLSSRRSPTLIGPANRAQVIVADSALSLAGALVLTYQSMFDQKSFLATNIIVVILGAYYIGRHAPKNLGKTYAAIMTILAVWGVLEFLTGYHVFANWFSDNGGIGPDIQVRGGLARSEATLGHAIAYGAALVAALPFTREFRKPWLLQCILLAGVLSSLSRGPIIAALLTFALMLYSENRSLHRARSFALFTAGFVIAALLFTTLYDGSGQAELESSSSARDTQLELTLGATNLFGPATGSVWDSILSRYVTNGVSIVDSTYLRYALDFGWFVTFLLLLPFLLASLRTLFRKSGSASVAVAGQIPILLVTSMITQWQVLVFFLAGMAVTEWKKSRKP